MEHDPDDIRRGAERNLARLDAYVAGASFHAWMPIFFLFFSSRVSLADVLLLEAVYYVSVVAMELPSGYMSDRLGRARTLVASALALIASHALFVLGSSFAELAAAQFLLAAAIAFNSGTDASLHLESLTALGREDEYAEREAKLSSLGFAMSAAAALAGGALGAWDLRAAYTASGLGALLALACALGFTDVTREDRAAKGDAPGFAHAVAECARLARSKPLRWLFAATLVGTVVNHVPYEFYQPYLESLDEMPLGDRGAPLAAGVHMMIAQLLAAGAASRSTALARRVGLRTHILASMGVQIGLVALMAWLVHPVVALLLLGRSMVSALQSAPIRAAVAPRVPAARRATYLSLQSLAARLGFATTLWLLSSFASDSLGDVLRAAALGTLAAWVALLLFGLASPPPSLDVEGE